MRARVQRLALLAIGVSTLAGLALTYRARTSPSVASSGDADITTARVASFSEREERDTQIRVWRIALAADSTSALVLGQLAGLYAQRAREGGGEADYHTAEVFARQSMDERTGRNGATAVTLVSVLLAQHRFVEARDVAADLVSREPEEPSYRALLGEVAMELGDYDTARPMFESVWSDRGRLSTASRLARWLELTGHSFEARELLRTALESAMARRDVANETKAWFHLRLGDMEARAGKPHSARKLLETALEIEPNDPRVQSALAHLAFTEAKWEETIAWGERSIATQLDPALLGLIADAYRAHGDTARSTEYANAAAISLSAQTTQHRAASLFLLDRGEQITTILAQAQQELVTRKDVYGYDLVAWALHRAGRNAEAVVMMRQALALRTDDPLLARHAAAITKAAAVASREAGDRRVRSESN